MKNKIIRTFLTAILVHILPAITLYYTLGWTDELPDELTARPTLVLLGTFASAVLWFNNFRVLFYVIDVSDRKSIDCNDEQECIAYMIGDFQYGNCIAWISPDYENAFVAQEGPQPDN